MTEIWIAIEKRRGENHWELSRKLKASADGEIFQ